MVELKPREYRAVCGVIGESVLDDVSGESASTHDFWRNLERFLRPKERAQLEQALKGPL